MSAIGLAHRDGKRSSDLWHPVRTFVDPAETNRVGLIVEVPDMDAFRLDEHHNRFGTNPVKSHSVGRHLGFHHLQ